MASSNLIRWSGLAAIVAGVLLPLADVLDRLLFPPGTPFTAQVTTSVWWIPQAPALVAEVLLLWALVGLYSHQADRAGALGLIGFLTAFVGVALFSGTQWGFFILGPDLAKAAPTFLDSGLRQPSRWLGIIGFIIPIAVLALGWVLFGLASLRAKVFPRWAAVLFMVAPLSKFAEDLVGLPIGNFVFGAGLIWMGYILWAGTDEPVQVQAAAAD